MYNQLLSCEFHRIERKLDALLRLLRGESEPPITLGLHSSSIHGKVRRMPINPITHPELRLQDVEFDILSIQPRDADNQKTGGGATYDWSVAESFADDGSGDTVITLEDAPAGSVPDGTPPGFARLCRSGVPGLANVHVKTTLENGDVLEEIQPVRIVAGQPNALNLSAGPPQIETPPPPPAEPPATL